MNSVPPSRGGSLGEVADLHVEARGEIALNGIKTMGNKRFDVLHVGGATCAPALLVHQVHCHRGILGR